MLYRGEIANMKNETIIVNIFFKGIVMSGDGGTKREDKELRWMFDELEKRGVITDAADVYERTNR